MGAHPHYACMEQLRSDVISYLAATGMRAGELGSTVMNDHRFVPRLLAGKSCSHETAVRLRTFMDANPPADVAAA